MKKYKSPDMIFKNTNEKYVMLELLGFSDVLADLGEEEDTESGSEGEQ